MPRDTGGDYSLPAGNPVTSGTTIQSSWANTTLNDISVALTDSLDRDGRGGMRAAFKFADGTVSDPGIQWTSETNTGIYRAALGDMRVTVLGSDLFRWEGSNVQIWANAQWNDIVYAGGPGGMPDGSTDYQSLSWDVGTTSWIPTSALLINHDSNTVTTASDLAVGGNIIIPGQVDGRDVSADGAAQDAHIGNPDIHFVDVNIDGVQYARKDQAWVPVAATGEVIPPGTVDGQTVRWDTTGGSFVTDSNLLVHDDGTASVGVTWVDSGGVYFNSKDATNVGVFSPSASDIVLKGGVTLFQDNTGVEKARFDASGRLGIGTQTPNSGSLLDVNGTIFTEGRALLSGNGAKWMEVRTSLPGTPDPNTLYFLTT
jgi:hypothetical protein